jgi:hypothetical protein
VRLKHARRFRLPVSEQFVVSVKPSARRANGAVGRGVNRSGTRHRFDSRDDAETWAAGLSARGERHVWVRAANPNDRSDVDAYLVSRRPRERQTTATVDGSVDQHAIPEYGLTGAEDE